MDVLALIHEEDAGPGVFAGYDEVASLALGRPPRLPIDRYDAVIVLGGDANVDQEAELPWLAEEKALIGYLLERRIPLLGVCLGAQLIAEVAGAEVGPLKGGPEIGWHEIVSSADGDAVLGAAPARYKAFEWHGYGFELPPGATELASGAAGPQAFRLEDAPAWGIQFHAEVDLATVEGWVRDYGPAAGVDPVPLAAETAREIRRWNEFGRGLSDRFLMAARARGTARR
jgi:GMP synthase-like glutamine amidotransferase